MDDDVRASQAPEPRDSWLPPRAVIGENVNRLRRSVQATMDQTARACRQNGLKWNASRIAELEAGKKSVTIDELLMLRAAMGAVVSRPVQVGEFFEGEGFVQLTGFGYTREQVREMLAPIEAIQESVEERHPAWNADHTAVGDDGKGVADQRAARILNKTLEEVDDLSRAVWGRTFTSERDRRAGSGSSAQHRGHVTRALIEELRLGVAQ